MQNLFFLLVKKPLRPRLFVSYFDLNVPLLYNSFSTYNRVQRDRSLNENCLDEKGCISVGSILV